mmetsp:Transcript_1912/g.2700  ORF Transcript_1912/g.2700 Transcript_1912/m.2700 type:complete len:112 (-) Transcript_1912:165-500(-)
MVVCGNNSNRNTMQMFCLSQQKRIHSWDFNPNSRLDYDSGFAYATRFSQDGNFVFSGGAGKYELKVFANNVDSTANYKVQMEIKDLPCPVYCIDKNPNPALRQFAFGLNNG